MPRANQVTPGIAKRSGEGESAKTGKTRTTVRRQPVDKKIIRTIRNLQKQTKLMIPHNPFERVIRQVADEVINGPPPEPGTTPQVERKDVRFSGVAITLLQLAAEQELNKLFATANKLTIFSLRKKLLDRDFQMALELQRDMNPNTALIPSTQTSVLNGTKFRQLYTSRDKKNVAGSTRTSKKKTPSPPTTAGAKAQAAAERVAASKKKRQVAKALQRTPATTTNKKPAKKTKTPKKKKKTPTTSNANPVVAPEPAVDTVAPVLESTSSPTWTNQDVIADMLGTVDAVALVEDVEQEEEDDMLAEFD